MLVHILYIKFSFTIGKTIGSFMPHKFRIRFQTFPSTEINSFQRKEKSTINFNGRSRSRDHSLETFVLFPRNQIKFTKLIFTFFLTSKRQRDPTRKLQPFIISYVIYQIQFVFGEEQRTSLRITFDGELFTLFIHAVWYSDTTKTRSLRTKWKQEYCRLAFFGKNATRLVELFPVDLFQKPEARRVSCASSSYFHLHGNKAKNRRRKWCINRRKDNEQQLTYVHRVFQHVQYNI